MGSDVRSQPHMTAVDRTSKLLEKLQQVEAISEDARQALRRERSDLAAHEEELMEQVQNPRTLRCFTPAVSPDAPLLQLRVLQIDVSSKVRHCRCVCRCCNPLVTLGHRLTSSFAPKNALKSSKTPPHRPTSSTSGRCLPRHVSPRCCRDAPLLQMFSLREHLLAVEKQRDAKAQEAMAWAARVQEVQDDCNTQMSYQQIEIQVQHRFPLLCCPFAPSSRLCVCRLCTSALTCSSSSCRCARRLLLLQYR